MSVLTYAEKKMFVYSCGTFPGNNLKNIKNNNAATSNVNFKGAVPTDIIASGRTFLDFLFHSGNKFVSPDTFPIRPFASVTKEWSPIERGVFAKMPEIVLASDNAGMFSLLPQRVVDTALKVAYSLKNENRHYRCIIDNLSQVLARASDLENTPTIFSPGARGVVYVHNHPYNSSNATFSLEDVKSFINSDVLVNLVATPRGLFVMSKRSLIDRVGQKATLAEIAGAINSAREKFICKENFARDTYNDYLDYCWRRNASKLSCYYGYIPWPSSFSGLY